MTRDHAKRDRPVPDVDPDEYDGFDAAPPAHRISTAGLASQVYADDRSVLGHVVMLDLDDVDPAVALEQAERLDDVAVVLRSSAGCYHVVGLGVRPFDEAVATAEASASCPEYVAEMREQGRFVARTMPKFRQSTGETYKDEPEPVAVASGDGPVSRPHAIRFAQLAEDVGRDDVAAALEQAVDEVAQAGRTLTVSRYETLTDELRAVLDAHAAEQGGEARGE